ncbi:Protein rolling stone [Holothuria leucospilota]|uniref:Protein rolling stone n=1 Tax=Holothuria leucospilota TaxID=206669 RepID=A0A9Q1BD87_HOLLE|nr:Protein rolling stone [Holothuria leucospilota]
MNCQEQCHFSGFFFSGVDPNLFANPQAKWLFQPWSFILYRLILAVYQVVTLLLLLLVWGEPPYYSLVDDKLKWFTFVSNWAYLLTTIYTVWAFLTTLYWHINGKKENDAGSYNYDSDLELKRQYHTGSSSAHLVPTRAKYTPPMPWYFKVTWFLQVLTCSSEFAVTVFYWVYEYPPEENELNFFTGNVHGGALFLVVLDFLMSAHPYRILHFIYTALFASAYYVFSYVYYLLDGTSASGNSYIYKDLLDWENQPLQTALLAIILIVMGCPPFHFVFCILCALKMAVAKCCDCCSYDSQREGQKA